MLLRCGRSCSPNSHWSTVCPVPIRTGKHLFGGILGELGLDAPFRATRAFGSGLVIARYRTTCVGRSNGGAT